MEETVESNKLNNLLNQMKGLHESQNNVESTFNHATFNGGSYSNTKP